MEVLFDLSLRHFVAIAVYVALGPKHIEHLMYFGLFSMLDNYPCIHASNCELP